jgi:capsular exopolysaccharide synthesis family protein
MRYLAIQEEHELSGVMRDTFRRIKVNIEFSGLGQKSICITSSVNNEGKSTMALGIARAFAEDFNKKVLLVDADIRNSILHKRLQYEKSTQGLTECLTGKIPIANAIYATNIEGFYLTPSGRVTRSSTQLLKRDTFKEYLRRTKEAFDIVIIDTSPLGPVVDAEIIASLSDASLLVTGADMLTRKEIKRNIQALKRVNENFLGVILNKAKEKSDGYGKRYYKYYGEEIETNGK